MRDRLDGLMAFFFVNAALIFSTPWMPYAYVVALVLLCWSPVWWALPLHLAVSLIGFVWLVTRVGK